MNLFILWAILACTNFLYQRFGVNVSDYGMAFNISLSQGAAFGVVAFSNWMFKESE
jgi:hypothetical protein